jgi:hypothetical protein
MLNNDNIYFVLMKKWCCIPLLLLSISLMAQGNYWQQYLHYSIDVTLNDNEKTLTGNETIVYKNNSPSRLDFIWFHLYPNAYKDKTTALFQQLIKDPDRKENLKQFTGGSISNLAFTVDGKSVIIEPHPNKQYVDVVKLILPQPLQPGDSIVIATPFVVQLPAYFSRSGYEDNQYMVCQWYPKPAVFDRDGWHEMPYLDRGEFYSEYASYKVNITLPSAYVVGATGVLQTTEESNAYKAVGHYNYYHQNNPKLYECPFEKGDKILTYEADSVPDFAWFAKENFIIQYDTIQVTPDKTIDAFTYYLSGRNTNWANSLDYLKDAVRHYNNWIGIYDYPIVQAVEGPKNHNSGGMEYPTITLITEPGAGPEALDIVIAHEVGHNWFMSMIGTNERSHAWMDEGLNTYFEFRYEAEKYKSNQILGALITEDIKKLNTEDFQFVVYKALLQLPIQPALETSSEQFKNNREYSLTAYIKAANWMYLLEASIGKDKVDKSFQSYFNEWKFKHPQPADMESAFEHAIGKGLT